MTQLQCSQHQHPPSNRVWLRVTIKVKMQGKKAANNFTCTAQTTTVAEDALEAPIRRGLPPVWGGTPSVALLYDTRTKSWGKSLPCPQAGVHAVGLTS